MIGGRAPTGCIRASVSWHSDMKTVICDFWGTALLRIFLGICQNPWDGAKIARRDRRLVHTDCA
jgi:hypothetical protein